MTQEKDSSPDRIPPEPEPTGNHVPPISITIQFINNEIHTVAKNSKVETLFDENESEALAQYHASNNNEFEFELIDSPKLSSRSCSQPDVLVTSNQPIRNTPDDKSPIDAASWVKFKKKRGQRSNSYLSQNDASDTSNKIRDDRRRNWQAFTKPNTTGAPLTHAYCKSSIQLRWARPTPTTDLPNIRKDRDGELVSTPSSVEITTTISSPRDKFAASGGSWKRSRDLIVPTHRKRPSVSLGDFRKLEIPIPDNIDHLFEDSEDRSSDSNLLTLPTIESPNHRRAKSQDVDASTAVVFAYASPRAKRIQVSNDQSSKTVEDVLQGGIRIGGEEEEDDGIRRGGISHSYSTSMLSFYAKHDAPNPNSQNNNNNNNNNSNHSLDIKRLSPNHVVQKPVSPNLLSKRRLKRNNHKKSSSKDPLVKSRDSVADILLVSPSKSKKLGWTNDSQNCTICNNVFKFNLRKHHCRNCYDIVCGDCSMYKMKLPHKHSGKKKVRVCNRCYTKLTEVALEKANSCPLANNFLQYHLTLENSFKVVIFGPPGAGKTAFVQKSVTGKCPSESELATMLGVATHPVHISLTPSDKNLRLPFHIWDISGSPRYHFLLDSYCKQLDCCILSYDVTRAEALNDLTAPWINLIRQFDRTNTVVALLGLKADQTSHRRVSKEDGANFAKMQAFDFHMEVSAHEESSSLLVVYQKIAELFIQRHLREELLSGPRVIS